MSDGPHGGRPRPLRKLLCGRRARVPERRRAATSVLSGGSRGTPARGAARPPWGPSAVAGAHGLRWRRQACLGLVSVLGPLSPRLPLVSAWGGLPVPQPHRPLLLGALGTSHRLPPLCVPGRPLSACPEPVLPAATSALAGTVLRAAPCPLLCPPTVPLCAPQTALCPGKSECGLKSPLAQAYPEACTNSQR